MPEDGYNGKDIFEIGKDFTKHPEIKNYAEEARLKEFKVGVEYEIAKIEKSFPQSWISF